MYSVKLFEVHAILFASCLSILSSVDSGNPPVDVKFVLSARGLPDTDEFGRGSPDPYVEISYFDATGSRNPSFVSRTKSLDNNHNPNWDEVFHVKFYEGRGQRLKFKVMDYEILVKDEEIGIVEVQLKEIAENKASQLSKTIIGPRAQNGKLIIFTKIGDKLSEDTDARFFKKGGHISLEK